MPVPNTFNAGETAVAEEVNENFTDLDGRVETLEAAPPAEVSQAELDAEAAARAAADTALDGRVDTLEAADNVTEAELTARKGAANGIASLGSDGKVPSAQLPAESPGTTVGILADRPIAATAGAGAGYFATDDAGGTLYLSDGTTWHTAGPRATELGLTTIAADFATTSTSFVIVTGMYVDVTVRDRPVMLRAWFRQANHSAASTWAAYVALREQGSSTNLAFAQIGGSSNSEPQGGFTVEAPISPSAGAHRYEVWCATVTAGTLTLKMGADHKGFISVTER